jgi:hypothetical protein
MTQTLRLSGRDISLSKLDKEMFPAQTAWS